MKKKWSMITVFVLFVLASLFTMDTKQADAKSLIKGIKDEPCGCRGAGACIYNGHICDYAPVYDCD